MDEKEKEKKRNRNWVVFLLLAGALAAAARPSIRFFEALIADGEPTAVTFTAAAIICGLIAIVLLSAIAGLLYGALAGDRYGSPDFSDHGGMRCGTL